MSKMKDYLDADTKNMLDFQELGISNILEYLSISSFIRKEEALSSSYSTAIIFDDNHWERVLGDAKEVLGEEKVKKIKSHVPKEYPLGMDLSSPADLLAQESTGLASSGVVEHDPETLPIEIDMIGEFPEIRDQDGRGTCVAHATVALREYLTNDIDTDLSEQFLYWYCKKHDGNPNSSGTYIKTAFEGLFNMGVCEEDTWPYNPKQTNNEGQGPPPPGAIDEAKKYRILKYYTHDNKDINGACALLAASNPLVFGVPVYPSWGNYATQNTGKVFMPLRNEKPRGGHALIMVGYNRDEKSPGGGYFIFRNSWGEDWASESPHSPGYGTIPFAYIKEYGRTLFTSDAPCDDTDVVTPVMESELVVIGGSNRGKTILGRLNEDGKINGIDRDAKIHVDTVTGDEGWHVVFICGKSGSGKSHTLAAMIENILIDNGDKKAIAIIDAEGEHWSFREPSPRKNELDKWGMKSKSFPTRVLVPKGSTSYNVKQDGEFSFAISDLKLDDWCAAFKVKGDRQIPLLRRLLECMKKPWYFVDRNIGIREIVEPTENFGIGDLSACLKTDEDINDPRRGFSKNVIRGVENVLSMANNRPWLDSEGDKITDLVKGGEITVFDLSGVSDDRERVVIAELIARKLFDARLSKVGLPPVYMVVDEAQLFAPKKQKDFSAPSLIKIAKRGRKRGLSLICATQQPSATNIELMSQVTLMIGHILTKADDIRSWHKDMPKNLKRPNLTVANLARGEAIISDSKCVDLPPFKILVRPRLSGVPQEDED